MANRIKQDISNGSFAGIYLLYGNEEVLKKHDRNQLLKALANPDDEMNVTYFNSENYSDDEVISLASTMPFLAEHRVICVTDSGVFKKSSIIPDYVDQFPESTHIIFCEKEVDQKNRFFKYVSEKGAAIEETTPGAENMKYTVAAVLGKEKIRISEETAMYLIQRVGTNLSMLRSELDKLIGYCLEKGYVENSDIEDICIEIPENKVFVMLDAALEGNSEKAFHYYRSLLEAQEKPAGILSLMNSGCSNMYRVSALRSEGKNIDEIVSALKMQRFLCQKYMRLGQKKSPAVLKKIMEYGLDLEYRTKIGNMEAETAMEVFIVKLSNM